MNKPPVLLSLRGLRAFNRVVTAFVVCATLTAVFIYHRVMAATAVPMASTTVYSENFADITNWTANFASGTGASRWGSVAVNATGTIPDGVKTTASSATFVTGSSGGVQKGTGTINLLSTGTTDNTSSVAIDLFLDFTGVNAGALSFDWASVDNGAGDRKASLRVYTSTDGTTFTELTSAAVLNFTNNAATSGSISTVSLPSGFNNSSTARIRFYEYNGTGGTTGSRPKISIDNVTVTLAQSSLKLRSGATGNWNSNGTWQMSGDGANWISATQSPTSTNDTTTILSGHTVTVTANVNADQLTVNSGAQLNVNSGVTLTVDDGTGTDMTVNGSATINATAVISGAGSFTLSSSATLTIGDANGISLSAASGNIQATGTRTFSSGANYNYNGGGAQATGDGLTAGNNITIQNTSGVVTLTAGVTVNGTFNINSSTTLYAGTNVLSGGGVFNLLSAGTLGVGSVDGITSSGATGNVQTGTRNFNTGASYTYNGSAAQVTGNGLPATVNNLTISNSAGVSLTSSAAVNGALTLTSGTFAVGTNTLTLNSTVSATSGSLSSSATGTVSYNQGSNGQSVLAASYGNLTFSNFNKTLASIGTIGIAATFTSGTATGHTITGSTIHYNGSSPQTAPTAFEAYNNLTISNGVTFGAQVTVYGTLQINNGGSFSGTAPFYEAASTLLYNTSSGFSVGAEWTGDATSPGSGVPNNVTIQASSGTVTMPTSSRGLAGNLTISSGTLALSTTSGDLSVAGNWDNTNGTLTPNGRTVRFNGPSAQTITTGGSGAGKSFSDLDISKTSTATLAGDLSTSSLTIAFGTLDTSTSNFAVTVGGDVLLAGGFEANGSSISIGGSWQNGGIFTPGTSTVTFNGSGNTQTLDGDTTFKNLTINHTGAGSVTAAGSTLAVTGLLHVVAGTFTSATQYAAVTIDSGGATLSQSGDISVSGNWTNNGTFNSNGFTVTFNGSSNQTIAGSGPTTFTGLTINNSAGITLGVNTTVSGALALTSGDLNTGSFTLFMGTGATSSGNGDVVGNVNRGDINGGTPRSFGNPNVQITETAGTVTDITVNLAKNVTANDFSNSVKRIYTITPNTPASLITTLRLRYLDSELNSNTEDDGPVCSLKLWKKSTTWVVQGSTTCDSTANWVELTGVNSFSPWTIASVTTPTDVAMMNFKATRYDKQVHLEWQTGYEVSNVGFNVYREKNGNLERITPEPVAGSALIAGLHVEMKAGLAYSWWDDEENAECRMQNAECQNVRYWIEDIDLSGRTTNHGPFGVSEAATGDVPPGLRDQQLMRKRNSSLLSALGRDASLAQSADASTVPVEPTAKVAKLTAARMTIQAGVASQTAVKLSVQRAGWYRVEQSELVAAGLPSGADPMMLQLFADGREVPMLVTNTAASSKKTSGSSVIAGGAVIGGGGSGGAKTSAWDGIEFYGIGIDSPSTANHVYWLAAGSQPGLRIGGSDAKGGSAAPSSFAYAVERRDKTIYFPALKNGGAEKWFGPLIYNAQPVDQSVTLQHVASSGGGGNALMTVSLQGFTNTAHTVRVLFNSIEVGTMHFSGLQKASNKFTIPAGNLHDGVNQIQLIGPAGTSDLSLVESVQVNYFHTNTADNNLLRLPVSGQQQVTIDGFTGSAIRVMDVTDANSPVELPVSVGSAAASKQATSSAYSVTVTAPSSGARTLLAFAADQQKRPAQIAANQPSNYRDPGLHADYLIITRKDLIGSFDPLIALRKGQGLTSMVIDVEDLYDEFGFGNKSPQAIKDFLTYAKTTWTVPPSFVVLAGDATYDPKNYLALGDFDVVPTRFVETAFNEAATDDWFADMNNDGVPDIAIGRLPVRTPAEAAAMVAKLVNYDSSAASNNVLLVADRNSNYDFEAADAQLRALIPASFTVTDIRRGQLGDADARTQLLAALNSGAKVVNYYGHGSTTVWTDAPILSASDAAGLTNTGRLSLVVSMTCLNGYFYTPTIESLGESLLKAQGGAIAVWASSGLTDPSVQAVMSRDAISRLLGGSNLTIGEVVALAKAAITNQDVRRTWILLGDPATRLRDETASKPK